MVTTCKRRWPGPGGISKALFSIGVAATALMLSSCASLPSSGPTVHQVVRQSHSGRSIVPFALIPLDADALRRTSSPFYPGIVKLTALAGDPGLPRADMIHPGDTLSISVFEVGVSLFGGGASATVPRMPTAATQVLTVEVREDGFITLPYAGRIMAAGAYPEELAAVIRRHLKPNSENPEVGVSIEASVTNVVYVGGAVAKSGRYRLTAAHERLLDILAVAGGSSVDPNELEVRLERGRQTVTAPLNRIDPGDSADLRVQPGDRIQLVRVRQSYTVFGASDKVAQVYFDAKDISLAEAVARAAGPSEYRANPRGIFLCRYETGPDDVPKPVVYQLDLMKTDGYFLAQRFAMHDKDVILFANASGTMTQKLVGLLSSLFTPVATVRYATQ